MGQCGEGIWAARVTLTRRQATELLEAHGLSPSRALGQNFVVDPNTVRRIARLAEVGPGDRVLEIGPGLGSLTLALVETGATVCALEIDRYVLPVLRSLVEPKGVRVIEGDAMNTNWDEILQGQPHTLVANLPYNISTPLILDLLDGVALLSSMLVMVQREVGERLAAKAGDDAYGAVSVKVAYWAEAKVVGIVPPTVFLPQPKVDSALVRIVRRDAPAVDPSVVSAHNLFAVVRKGFGQRRKMLRRALAGMVGPEAFETAGVRPEARAEELDVTEWGRLAAAANATSTATKLSP